jgi:hypothetical protein
VTLLAALSIPAVAATAGEAALRGGPYVLAPRPDGGTVCWHTAEDAPGTVRYRLKGTAKWRELAGKRATFHSVGLTKLEAGRDYEIRISIAGKEVADLVYRTPAPALKEFTFFVYGDTRSNPLVHAEVAAALAAEAKRLRQPTFTLMTGDLAHYRSDAKATAEQFFKPAAPVLRIMPLLPVRGNHECGTKLFGKYFAALPRPQDAGGADDYVVDYGSVRVVVLDQYQAASSKGPRMKWLAARLAEAADRWRIVSFHEPIYSSGAHGSNSEWKTLVDPILRQYKVNAVFCGHDHNYERTKPQGGVVHFTAGGGGAPLRRAGGGEPGDFSAKFEPTYHFVTVKVTPEKLAIKAHEIVGDAEKVELLDSTEIPWTPGPQEAELRLPAGEVHYGRKPNPWKKPILYGGIALLVIALAAKAVQLSRRKKQSPAAD